MNDQTGAVIPGASLPLRIPKRASLEAMSPNHMDCRVMPGIAPGGYELTVTAKGFGARKSAVTLSVGQTASLTVTLGVTVTEELQVQDVIQGIDTEKADISQVIDTPK